MPAREEALPGRAERQFQVNPTHVVLGTPLEGPWPEGSQVLYVAMGCFWGVERIFWRQDGVVSTAAGYTHQAIAVQVQAALVAYINSLPLGAALTYSRLAQVAYDASPAVTNVTNTLLNGSTADLPATSLQVIKTTANSITVT